ncbi:MAG: UvrD-helicase domain-containing protein [Gammaproteobacteria bacterium]|nr:UvrD-helicase domain-containing protein [Gammaproteobacteria bacterium]
MNEQRIDPADWPDAIRRAEGPQIVVGGPGTGKTEFLVRRAHHVLEDGVRAENLLLLSFSRRGVADLRERLESLLARSGVAVPVATFHSLASRLLETFGQDILGWTRQPTLLTGPEQVALVHELLTTEDPARWPLPFRSLLPSDAFAHEVTDFVLRCSEQLIGPDRLAVLASDRADWKALPAFLERYRERLRTIGRTDYGSLLADAVNVLEDPQARDAAAEQYRFVLVDEYQDTTPAQVGLLQRLTAAGRNLTVAADPYQSIYSFRGADLHNVALFPELFTGPGDQAARRLILTTSFRVPRHILAAAERVTAGGALPGAAGAVTPAPGGGSVEVYGFTQQSEEAEWLAREIQRLHLEEGCPYGSMAVFVRSKRRFLPELSRSLERRGIPHDQPDARLTDHPTVRVIFDCAIAATTGGIEQHRAIRRILLGPLFQIPLGRLRELERSRAEADIPWSDAIRTGIEGGELLADLLEDAAWATSVSAVDGFWNIWTSLPQIAEVVADPGRREERAAWTSLAQVLGRLAERDPSTTLNDYRRLADQEDFEATPLLSYRAPEEDRLTLTTLHQSKGLQFDFVFIADAVEGTFPDLRSRESLLGSRHLTPSIPDDTPDYLRFRLQEEMRLAYTAISRARKRVVWTCTSRGFDEGRGMPSRFLPAVAGTTTVEAAISRPPEWTHPVTALEAEAWLRRIVGDPGEASVTRTAALSLLVDGPRWGLRPWHQFAGVRRRGSDTGLVGADLVMSPSKAEAYQTCPRKFVFERLLHVGDEPNSYASLGSVVHEALERAEQSAMERGDRHADLDEALEHLSALWNPAEFGGEPWAAAWFRRAERILTHLYEHWPGTGLPVALERWLDLDVDGVPWHGKADRIEVTGDGIVIVDYKTGANPLSLPEAAISIQLGFYAMATAADPELPRHGPVVGAEMWYPAKTDAKSVPVRRLDLEQMDAIIEAMSGIATGIRTEDWTPVPSRACEYCRVRLVCPEWPEGQEAFRP